MVFIMLLPKAIYALIQFAQVRDIFIGDFVAAMKV